MGNDSKGTSGSSYAERETAGSYGQENPNGKQGGRAMRLQGSRETRALCPGKPTKAFRRLNLEISQTGLEECL